MGYDTMKTALHNYFEKHQWGNTELSDFISSLQQAYDNSTQKKMGENFNFTSWGNSWLVTSGVNILEATVVKGANDSISNLNIKQISPNTGQN